MALQGFGDWTPTTAQAQILAKISARAQQLRQPGQGNPNDPVLHDLVGQLAATNGGQIDKDWAPALGQAISGDPDFMTRTKLGDFLAGATKAAGVGAGILLGGEALGIYGGAGGGAAGASSASSGGDPSAVPDIASDNSTMGQAPQSGTSPSPANIPGSGAPKQSIWQQLIGPGISAIGNVAGSAIAANASSHAADLQAQAAQNSLDFLKGVYQQRRTDLNPAITGGNAALNRLSSLYGFAQPPPPAFPGSVPANAPASAPPAAGASNTTAPMSPPAMAGMITVQAPTGETRQVPAALASFYQGKGATVMS